MTMRTIQIKGIEHPSAHNALVELNFYGRPRYQHRGAVLHRGRGRIRRLEIEGVQPTTWHHHEATGRIVSVPGRH